jgi:Cutinase
VAAVWTLPIAPVPSASAGPCPDVEVVFARGTTEPPGVGAVGQNFVDTLRSHVGAISLRVAFLPTPSQRGRVASQRRIPAAL